MKGRRKGKKIKLIENNSKNIFFRRTQVIKITLVTPRATSILIKCTMNLSWVSSPCKFSCILFLFFSSFLSYLSGLRILI